MRLRIRPLLWLCCLSPQAQAQAHDADAPFLHIDQDRATVELTPWQRGHLNMYLEQNGLGCQLAQRRQTHGALKLRLQVRPGRPNQITILDDRSVTPRSFPGCLKRILRNAQFSKLTPDFEWEGTLRYDDFLPYRVQVTSLYGKMLTLTMQQVVIAALAAPAPCMDRFFQATPAVSRVLLASFDVTPEGAVSSLEVKESTAGPPDTPDCVKQQLSALNFPDKELTGAKLHISLLRLVRASETPGDVPAIIMKV